LVLEASNSANGGYEYRQKEAVFGLGAVPPMRHGGAAGPEKSSDRILRHGKELDREKAHRLCGFLAT